MESVAHDGRATPYRTVGLDSPGPTAVYVHGSGATHQIWANQYGPHRPIGAVGALDLAGHGGATDVGADEAALGAYVDDVAAVADAVDANLLVGNSLGGAVALQAVLDGRVDPGALVLVGTGAKLAVRDDLRDLLASDFDRAIDVLHADGVLFHDPSDTLRERSMATMRAVGQRVVRRDFLTCHSFDVRDRLGEIDVPALALVGEYDSLTPPAYHEYLAEEIPGGEWDVVDGAAHLAMLEQPGAFEEAIAAFTERALIE